MKLPPEVLATRDRYVATFPLWEMPGGPEAEERARNWTWGLASQICFEHPDEGYGSKRADPGRPISKDAVAQQTDDELYCWDMLTGAGSGYPALNVDPDAHDITGQVFEPVPAADVIASGEIPVAGGGDAPDGGGAEMPAIPYNDTYAVEFGLECNDVYTESGATFDPGMISVHSQRAAWDYYVGGMSWPDSKQKHINEFRAEYGLPPE